MSKSSRPNPARVVADAEVLAADLFGDESARTALDHVRAHDWVELVASEELLEETESLVASLADVDLATDHRTRLEAECVAVEHPPEDHPALASAYRGRAAHLLTFDDRLTSAKAGLTLQPRVAVSIRDPAAFAQLFDPESLYEAVVGETYDGPDADPRE